MAEDSPVRTAENPQKANGAPKGQDRKKRAGFSQNGEGHSPDIHRALPASLDAEKGVLGSILLSPIEVLSDCIERIDEHHFHHPAHSVLYGVLVDLWRRDVPIDLVTLTQTLRDQDRIEAIGGAAALADLFTFVPTAANADYYLEILREKYLLRQVISVCTQFASRAYEEQGEARQLLDEVEAHVLAIGEQRYQGRLPEMQELVMQAIESIERLYHNRGEVSGLSTGFVGLDKLTSGLHAGDMFVIAARPSMGKTAVAMNIAEHVAVGLNKPVAIFSLEMSTQSLIQRLLCSLAHVNMQRIRDGMLSKQDFPKLTAAAEKLARSRMYIDDSAGLNILELRAKARRLRDSKGIELVVIDYLQLLRSQTKRAQENRQIEIAEISAGVKALAKELRIPVIVLAQLNREPEKRGDGKPRLSDLRESGSIEQDADVVALLVRSEVYEKDEDAREEKSGEAELIIAKQRNGPVGEVPLTFLKEFTRFEDRAIRADDERH